MNHSVKGLCIRLVDTAHLIRSHILRYVSLFPLLVSTSLTIMSVLYRGDSGLSPHRQFKSRTDLTATRMKTKELAQDVKDAVEQDFTLHKGAPDQESRTGGRLVSPRICSEKKN